MIVSIIRLGDTLVREIMVRASISWRWT